MNCGTGSFDALVELKFRPDLLNSFVHDAELPIDPYPDEH